MKNLYLKIIYKILACYARATIKKNNPTVIAITGSVGKTSTKEAIFAVLSDAFGAEVGKNEGNLNSEIGLPLSILGYKSLPNKFAWPFFLPLAALKINQKKYPKYLVLEMGVEKIGDIDYLTSIAKPDIVVITSTTPAHVANFKDVSEYQNEKISIIDHLKDNGQIFVNIDDFKLSSLRNENLKSISIVKSSADYFADEIKETIDGTEFRINCTGHKISIKSQLLGRHLVYSQLFAFAIADFFKLPLLKTGKALSGITPYPGRMNLIAGKNETTIIDDTYNSNPTSLKSALLVLSEIKHRGRKVAIIGNMNELGPSEKKAHFEVGQYAFSKCDLAIFVGPNAQNLSNGYNDKKSSLIFRDRKELITALPKIIKSGDLILIKASQNGNFFEEVTKQLMKNPKEANKLLVRQSKFWLRKK